MIELLNIDCMEYMSTVSDKYFDLAIVDPPYFKECEKEIFLGAAISTTGIKRNRFRSNHWNIPDQDYANKLVRISKNQIIWGWNYFDFKFMGSGRIIWDKNNDESSFSNCEIAFCSLHKSVKIYRFTWNGMLQGNMKDKEKRIHPTQKPIQLYKWLLKNYAKPEFKIIDTHGGSMSSVIAAYDFGIAEMVCCEIDKDYYDAAVKRFETYKLQTKLQF